MGKAQQDFLRKLASPSKKIRDKTVRILEVCCGNREVVFLDNDMAEEGKERGKRVEMMAD